MGSTQRRATLTLRAIVLALGATGCTIALAACGSSSHSTDPSSSTNGGIKFSECMRAHGVPNFPDPSGGGGGFQIPNGINPQSPAFQSAQKACGGLLGPRSGGKQGSEQRHLQLLRLAECMRAHGISGFPDPSNSPPSAPPSGGGIAFGGPGGFISVPQTMMQSPGFQQAATACGFPGAGGGGRKAQAL